jgi:exosortase
MLLSVIVFWAPLKTLIHLSLSDERFSHVIVIPFISLCLIYRDRKKIFLEPSYCRVIVLPLLGLGAIGFYFGEPGLSSGRNNGLSLLVAEIVLIWTLGFTLHFGTRALRAAIFPFCFLLLTIPIPPLVLGETVVALQQGSAEISDVLFKLIGVPAVRQDMNFSLPGFEIAITEQCSGIRSSIGLFIATLVAGHLLLISGWRNALLMLCVFPVAVFKNAVRIVTISWLAIHVDHGFLYGQLHHYGGLPFSLLDLAMLTPVLFFLKKSVRSQVRTPNGGAITNLHSMSSLDSSAR